MPRRDLRMLLAPIQMRETKIQIRKTATDCDVANPKSGVRERGGLLLQRSHRGLILGAKSIHEGLQRLRSLALLPPQNDPIQKSLAERLPPQRSPAGRPLWRKKAGPCVQAVQILAEFAGVVERLCVVEGY